MPKGKKKNLKKKEAQTRKNNAQIKLKQVGLDLNDDLFSVGIIFDSLEISQLTYLGLSNINAICQEYVGLDINLFVQQRLRSCIVPLCTIFDSQDLRSWQHYLIATNFSTCADAIDSYSPLIYYYAFDVDFLDRHDISTKDLLRIFHDTRIRIIARHINHKELIEREFGVKVHDIIIPNFEVIDIIKLMVMETKHAQNKISN